MSQEELSVKHHCFPRQEFRAGDQIGVGGVSVSRVSGDKGCGGDRQGEAWAAAAGRNWRERAGSWTQASRD